MTKMEGLRCKKELCTNEAAQVYLSKNHLNKMINNVKIVGLKKRGLKYWITMEYILGGGGSEKEYSKVLI